MDAKFKINGKNAMIEYQNVEKAKYPCYCAIGEYEAKSIKIISIN